ncbi:hypothetical protein Vretimale_14240 [Volvox reticuliferus]|uniref:Integrase catalytic domain-containing protein n=1 Tax=Volvox reticuliferus TaxID=1737510 RepID=A0A8J4CUL0_9CHLO|nr:hypothetical protein Vretifemale_15231 [Volvox reticuliferus]GIM10646.1 hypothetical protein Vretimale_14240 [Volvox reticuliferus]
MDGWYVDSGASQHITYDERDLVDVRKLDASSSFDIYSIGGEVLRPIAMGTLLLPPNFCPDMTSTVTNVCLIPESHVKVLSVAALSNVGATVRFDENTVNVCRRGRVLFAGHREGNLYALECQVASAGVQRDGFVGATHAKPANQIEELWHRRYGHIGLGQLERMVRCNLVYGINLDARKAPASGTCETCVMSKQSRGQHASTGHKSERSMELIHIDVCGPMPEESPSGSRYTTVLLDDFTKFSAVAFTDTKEAVKEKVVTMITQLENMCGNRTWEVRSDRGGEFVNEELRSFFRQKGIRHGMTVGYTPEQNGAVERLNRTLVEKMRALLLDSKLSQDMWAEAAATANYLRNISPAEGVPCTPYEYFTGKIPEVGHLRVFGCVAYVHVPKVKRNKLDPVSRRGILVGYGNGGQYRILFPDGVVSVHMDVEFDEKTVGVFASRCVPRAIMEKDDTDSDTDTEMMEQQAREPPPIAPTNGDGVLTHGDGVGSSTSGAGPSTGGVGPSTSGASPSTGGAGPSTSGASPSTGGAGPSTSGAGPSGSQTDRGRARTEDDDDGGDDDDDEDMETAESMDGDERFVGRYPIRLPHAAVAAVEPLPCCWLPLAAAAVRVRAMRRPTEGTSKIVSVVLGNTSASATAIATACRQGVRTCEHREDAEGGGCRRLQRRPLHQLRRTCWLNGVNLAATFACGRDSAAVLAHSRQQPLLLLLLLRTIELLVATVVMVAAVVLVAAAAAVAAARFRP